MVIILQKFFHNIPELGLRCQNKVIQTLLLEGLYKGFHVAVTLWRSRRNHFCLAANRMNNVLETLAEQRIAVMDKILLSHHQEKLHKREWLLLVQAVYDIRVKSVISQNHHR